MENVNVNAVNVNKYLFFKGTPTIMVWHKVRKVIMKIKEKSVP